MSLAAYASKTNKVEDERMKQQSKREYKRCLKLTLIGSMYPHPGADPGSFLGGGALVSCSSSTPINHVVFFLQNTSCIRKPQVISRGGGGAHPLHPPPRSTPAIRKNQSRMNQNSTFSSLVSDDVLEEFLVSKSSGLGEPSRLDGEGDSTEGEFRDDPLSVTVRLISSFHSRRNDASSSSSFFSSCTSS